MQSPKEISSEYIDAEIEKAKEFEPIARAIAETLSNKDNAINKFSNAKRWNQEVEVEDDSSNMHRLQIAIGEETAKRYKNSMNWLTK